MDFMKVAVLLKATPMLDNAALLSHYNVSKAILILAHY
jgi:hypothetical protein